MTNDEKNTSEFNIKKNTYSDCLSSDLNSDFKSDSSSDSSSDLKSDLSSNSSFGFKSDSSSNSSFDLKSDLSSYSSFGLKSDSSSVPMENSSSVVSPNNNETESNCLSLTIVDDCNHMIKRNKLYKAIRMFFKVSFSTAILNFIKFFL